MLPLGTVGASQVVLYLHWQHGKTEFNNCCFHKPGKFVIRLEELCHVMQFKKHNFSCAEVTIIISIIEMALLEI